jgi:hypothetical protein
MLRRQNRLSMTVVWRDLRVHGLVHSHRRISKVVGRKRRGVISRSIILGAGVGAAGEGVAVIRLPSIEAPVIEKIVLGHLGRMQLGDVVCQSIQLEAAQTVLRPFAINLVQEPSSQSIDLFSEGALLRKGEPALALTPRASNDMPVCFRNWRRLNSLAIWLLA